VIVIGSAAGLVRFRPGGGWPSRVSTFAPGERMPVRVTGALRTPAGLTQVREDDADLVRYVLSPSTPPPVQATTESTTPTADAAVPPLDAVPVLPAAEPVPTPIDEPALSSIAEPAPPPSDAPIPPPTTLILERRGRPHGVAVGRGELTAIAPGTVSPLRGTRPALRLSAGTGTLLVSFDTTANRDRAASELAAEAEI